MALVKAGPASGLSPGGARSVQAGDKEVAVFNVDGAFHAMDNACLHRGGPLCDGRLEGGVVTCPWHGWQFNVKTGELIMNPATKQKTYSVQVKGHDLYVEI